MAAMVSPLRAAPSGVGNVTSLSPNLPWPLANPKWAASLNPLLGNPLVNGNLLNGIKVTTGANVLNHGLGRSLQGYMVVMNNANVTFYDSQSTNPRPSLTLILNASGDATISLYVF
jgi:hypothetical protein